MLGVAMKETMYGQELEAFKHATRAEIEAAVAKGEESMAIANWRRQSEQQEFLRREEESIMRQEARSYDGYAPTRSYDLTCKTCRESKVMHSPANIAGAWLSLHCGHLTWIVRTL